eukprot:682300-Lingulodinium_polyedra.AAC.1
MDNPYTVHGPSTDSPCNDYGQSICPWTVHGQLSTHNSWAVHGLSMQSPWAVHGQCMDNPWAVHRLPMDCPRA